jgi:hemoglobin
MYHDLPVNKEALKDLFEKDLHGSQETLRALMLEFYERMAADVMLGFFFNGKEIRATADKQSEFFLRQVGALPSYSGKPPAQAHFQLPPILSGHFDRRLKILENLLLEKKITQPGIQAWLGFENAFRNVIVQK